MLEFNKIKAQLLPLPLILGATLVNPLIGLISGFLFLAKSYVQKQSISILFILWTILILSDNGKGLAIFEAYRAVFLIVCTLFLLSNSDKKQVLDFPPVKILKFGFVAFIAFSIVVSNQNEFFAVAFQRSISYFFIGFTVFNLVLQNHIQAGEKFILITWWFVLLVLAFGLVIRLVSPDFVTFVGRYCGFFRNPNGMGIFCVLSICILGVIKENWPTLISRRFFIVTLLFLVTSIISSGSRTALLSGLLFLGLLSTNKRLGFWTQFVLIGGVGLFFSNFTGQLTQYIIQFGMEDYFRLETLEDLSGRGVAWEFAVNNLDGYNWFGKGLGYTEQIFKDNRLELSMLGHEGNAHNSYLTLWLDVGLLGLLAYLVSLVLFIGEMAKKNKAAGAGFLTILVAINFESWLASSINAFTIGFVIFLGLSLISYLRQATPNNHKPFA